MALLAGDPPGWWNPYGNLYTNTWWPSTQPFYYQTTSALPCEHCWCDEETRGSKDVLHERCCKCQDVRLPDKEDVDADSA